MLSNDMGSIRAVQPDDLRFLMELRNDPNTWLYLGDPLFLSEYTQNQWYEKMCDDPIRQYLVYTDKKDQNGYRKSVGMVRLDEINYIHKSVRVGGDIHEAYRGKGHGTNMHVLIQEYCFDFLNMHRVWLLVTDYNTLAIDMYEKAGFKEEGRYKEGFLRFGKYHDYICMSILDYKD